MSGAERVLHVRATAAVAARRPAQPSQDNTIESAFRDPGPIEAPFAWPCLPLGHEPVHLKILERRLQNIIVAHPLDMELKTVWVALQRALAVAEREAGLREEADRRLNCASKALNEMLCFDPKNEMWVRQRETLDQDLSNIAIA
jgi:hypothetical protein